MTLQVIVKGKTKGKIMKTNIPINFLGAVDKKTGIIHDSKHEIFQKSIKNTILVFPYGVGSSVGAYTIYSLKSNSSAPNAMICLRADATVTSGCALANIPLVIATQDQYDSLENEQEIFLDAESGIIQ